MRSWGWRMRTGSAPIRVMIIDDHEVFSKSLALALEMHEDMQAVARVSRGAEAVSVARSAKPDVVLLDQRLPDGEGVSLISALCGLPSSLRVVMLSASTGDDVLVTAIQAGAAGFIDKTRGLDDVVSAIRAAAAGESLISSQLLARLLPRLGGHPGPAPRITDREREVLRLLAEGLSNADIATRLHISVHTVRNHVGNLAGKLGAHSKLEILSIALRDGLITP